MTLWRNVQLCSDKGQTKKAKVILGILEGMGEFQCLVYYHLYFKWILKGRCWGRKQAHKEHIESDLEICME